MWREIEKRRMSSGGDNLRDQYINGLIQIMEDSFEYASNFTVVLHEYSYDFNEPSTPYTPSTPYLSSTPYVPSTPHNYDEVEVRIISRVKNSSIITDDIRKIIFKEPYYPVSVGDYFKFEDSIWLCTSTNTNVIPRSCIVEKINNIAKFYDDYGNYYEMPCILKNNIKSLDEDQYMKLPNDMIEMRLKYTSNLSSLIKISPTRTRFIFNGQAYKVESIDTITNVNLQGVGIATVLLKSDQLSAYDDVNNGIADKYKPRNIEIVINNGRIIELHPDDMIQLDITVKVNGKMVDNPKLIFTSSDEDVAFVGRNGLITAYSKGSSLITVEYNGVKEEVQIEVVDVIEDSYSIIINGDDFIYIGREKTFEGVVVNNNNRVFDKTINWSLTDLDGNETVLASIIPDGNKVVVKANSNNKFGKVLLVGILEEDPYIINEKIIEIRSII